jgi:hypothetical protein
LRFNEHGFSPRHLKIIELTFACHDGGLILGTRVAFEEATMSKGKETLEELLSDPIIRLLMERDRVRPEEVRMLLRKAARNAQPSLAPHVIDQTSRQSRVSA